MRKPDVPCAGCGKLLYGGSTSLPPGKRKCRPCRAASPRPKPRPKQATRPKTRSVRTPIRHVCPVCSQTFIPSYGGQRTCSRTCGQTLRRQMNPPAVRRRGLALRVWIQPCATCGTTYATQRQNGKYCSRKCGLSQPASRIGQTLTIQCADCTLDFAWLRTRRGGSPARCGTCAKARVHAQVRAERRRRRARERSAASEPYTLAEIAQRDRSMCHICKRRVAMTKAVPHPKAPTIDHIIPLADGGDDTRANVRIAHFLCNSQRGSRGGGEQLALLG